MICGIRNDALNMCVGVDYMPHRTKPCLVIEEGNTETKYATFNNSESAKEFMEKLMKLCGVNGVNNDGI